MRRALMFVVLVIAWIPFVRRRICPVVLCVGEDQFQRLYYVVTFDGQGPMRVLESAGLPKVGEEYQDTRVKKCKARRLCGLGGAMLSMVETRHGELKPEDVAPPEPGGK